MKIYFVSSHHTILHNSGLIRCSALTYDEAFAKAVVGEYIHAVDVQDVFSVINAGKMAVRVDGSTEQE